jgi:glutathione S-transferase
MAAPPVRMPDGWRAPEPKPLQVPKGQLLSALTGSLALALRLGSGALVLGWQPGLTPPNNSTHYHLWGFRDSSPLLAGCARPALPLRLYEYEPSPYCRKVREAICILDLNATMLPCPRARSGFATELNTLGGKMQVPYLVDPNRDNLAMYESDEIIDYLFESYGPGKAAVPWLLRGPYAFWTCAFAALARGLAGNALDARARADNGEREPLELWGYEGSPFVRPVRERLCELGLAHTLVSCSRGSANRDVLVAKTGRFQVPFLADPNTGAKLFESDAIVRYLDQVYTAPDA